MTIINDLREAEYHAMPALSATGAWQLVNDCPAIYWHTSPFNPDAMPPETSEAMDIGTALHLAVLEPDRLAARVALCPGDDWRTKAAREAREQAQASGLISLLGKHIDLVYALRKALLANEFVAHMLDGAQTEVSYFWDDEGIPCKARADIITRDGLAIGDLKSSANASPEFFQRRAFDAGHFLRSPWYSEGWTTVSGKLADYWYIVVGRDAPYLVSVVRLDERAETWGEVKITTALRLFIKCRAAGKWPGYCDGPTVLGLPKWAEYRLSEDERNIHGK